MPYLGPYFKSLGYSAVDIGQLLAAVTLTKMVAPLLSAWLADHTGKGLSIVRYASLAAAVGFLGIFYVQSFYGLFAVMVLFSFFWNTALPLFEATTLTFLRGDADRYNRIRLWGSVGFIVAVLFSGEVIDEYGYRVFPGVLAALLAGIWVATLFVPKVCLPPSEPNDLPFIHVLKQPEVVLFLVSCFFMQASHSPYYAFYSIYLEEQGFSQILVLGYRVSLTALMWTLAVLAEVLLFMRLGQYYGYFSLRQILLASLMLSVLRWLLIAGGADSIVLLSFAQLLHAASFAAFHGVAVQLVHRYFVGKTQSRGQSLYSSVSFGAGGAVGTVMSGYYWEAWGGQATFLLAAGLSLLSWGLVFFGLRSRLVTS